ncbi:hypothetical protein [Nitratireductor pacificus]|uniref:hypothetical protein n=1 Tax=Nitratireductor pacificus TaxID=1231180 RepID=UPI0012F63232|nr:hypothetical protein [Nitratireductor pacificus]
MVTFSFDDDVSLPARSQDVVHSRLREGATWARSEKFRAAEEGLLHAPPPVNGCRIFVFAQ